MTYNTDPVRWTDSVEEAPEVLRGPFAAARNEGPSDLQMKALALKLAALSAGGAAAASAATAKASSTAASAATAAAGTSSFTLTKVALSVALLGAAATGVVVYQGQGERLAQAPRSTVSAPVQPVEQPAPEQPLVTQKSAPSTVAEQAPSTVVAEQAPSTVVAEQAPTGSQGPTLEAKAEPSSAAPAPAAATAVQARATAEAPARRSEQSVAGRKAARPSASAEPAPQVRNTSVTATREAAQATEVELLRRARAVLGGRPREAFSITEEHRRLYPSGVFTQERDALAIEALMRAGDMDTARSLAERFVREHPSSPHAHRFRETMGVR